MNAQFPQQANILLDKQVSVSEQMLDVLKQEYAVLKGADPSTLEALSQEKQNLVNQLESLSQLWVKLLDQSNVEITSDGIRSTLQSVDADGKLQLLEHWQQLGELATECQRQNAVNGAVVVVRQQTTQYTLDLIRGNQPGNTTYGKSGSAKSSGSPGVTIGKA